MSIHGVSVEELNKVCEVHHVHTLHLFGSALHKDTSENFDLDFLVSFDSVDFSIYLTNFISLKESLALLFCRKIDLIESQSLKNPILIRSINRQKELVYG